MLPTNPEAATEVKQEAQEEMKEIDIKDKVDEPVSLFNFYDEANTLFVDPMFTINL